MKKYLFLLGFAYLISACSNYSKSEFEKLIETSYSETCSELDTCTVSIADMTTFDWDEMYVFGMGADLAMTNEALGINYPHYLDPAQRVVFLKNKEIVYHDDYYPTFDDDIYTSLVFDLSNDEAFKSFSPENAKFNVEKKQDHRQTYFVLRERGN